MQPTLVTALFDLHGREAGLKAGDNEKPSRKSVADYLAHGRQLIEWPAPLVVFADPHVAPIIVEARSRLGLADKTVVHATTLESFSSYKKHRHLVEQQFSAGRKPKGYSEVKDTELYVISSWCKSECVRLAMEANPFRTTNFFWIDYGIYHVAQPPRDVARLVQRLGQAGAPLLAVFQFANEGAEDLARGSAEEWYAKLRQYCAGGIWGGPRQALLDFVDKFDDEVVTSANSFPSLEEAILFRMYAKGSLTNWQIVRTAGHYDILRMIERDMNKGPRKVCLCMMVKNESKIIERSLASVASELDGWCITDTGSTDDTPALIERFFADRRIPGELHRTNFVDFGHSRSETISHAVEFARSRNFDYLLLLDADEVVEVRDTSWKDQLDGSPYLLRYDDPLSYRIMYLVPTDTNWIFRGRTHEYLEALGDVLPRVNFDGIVLHDLGDGGSKADKFTRDIALLSRTLDDNPNDERAVFYLAESFLNGNIDVSRALELYTRRAAMGGFEEEAWYAAYRRGQCLERLARDGDDPWVVILAYFGAWERRPWRAEPLTEIVRFCAEHGLHTVGSIVGEYALAHVVPRSERDHDILFIDTRKHGASLWDWVSICHFRAGFRGRSVALATKARAIADESNLKRIDGNIALASTAGAQNNPDTQQLLDATRKLRQAALPVAANMIAEGTRSIIEPGGEDELMLDYEQSIAGFYSTLYREKARILSDRLLERRDLPDRLRRSVQQNRWFHAVPLSEDILRATRLKISGNSLPDGYRAMNPSLVRVGKDMIALVRAVNYSINDDGTYSVSGPVITRNFVGDLRSNGDVGALRELIAPLPDESLLRIRGFEDCRVFIAAGRTWGIANHSHPRTQQLRAMFLLELDDLDGKNPVARSATHLVGPQDDWHQKNWMPVDGADSVILIYSCDPTVVLRVDTATGHCDVQAIYSPPVWLGDLRGGSQLVPIKDGARRGYLAFVHGVLTEHPRRSYFHRIVKFDDEFRITGVSRTFVLQERAIEFVAGCVLEGEDLILTWGRNDAEAWVGRISLANALSLCAGT